MAGFADFTYWKDGVPFTTAGASGVSKFVFWSDGVPFSAEESAPPDPLASFTFASFWPDKVPHRKGWPHWQSFEVILPPPPPFVEPVFPATVPHRKYRLEGGEFGVDTAKVIPIPDILASETFQAVYPDQVPHKRLSVANMPTVFAPPVAPILIAFPAAVYPATVPHRRLAIASMPSVFEPSWSPLVVLAQSMVWAATFPAQVPHRRIQQVINQAIALNPNASDGTLGAGICVTLVNENVTQSTLIAVAVTQPTFLGEGVTFSTFSPEVC